MSHFFRTGYIRPTALPAVKLPLGARSVGHSFVPPDHYDTHKVRIINFVQVFWGVAGTGAIVIDGVSHRIPPEHIGVYFPGMQHRIHALGEPWEFRWWTMDGALALPTVVAFGLTQPGVYPAGPAPIDLFQALTAAINDVTPHGERCASARAYELLACCAAGDKPRSSANRVVQLGVEILHEEWNNPELDIGSLARRLGLHRSSFSRQFHAALGLAPSDYLMKLRMQNAMSLLKGSDLEIKEIADRCGWKDANYFSRCIRQVTGSPPHAFRQLSS